MIFNMAKQEDINSLNSKLTLEYTVLKPNIALYKIGRLRMLFATNAQLDSLGVLCTIPNDSKMTKVGAINQVRLRSGNLDYIAELSLNMNSTTITANWYKPAESVLAPIGVGAGISGTLIWIVD